MLVCVFLALIAHETAGASQHPAFPAPSDFLGAENSSTTRAQRVAGMRNHVHPRHCERSEAIHRAAQRKNGLLRRYAPRNDEFAWRLSLTLPWRGRVDAT